MGRVITVANRKGGVGKTTLVVALAHTISADEGKSVCVIDTDPQASATIALIGVDGAKSHASKHVGALLTGPALRSGPVNVRNCVVGHVSHLTNKPDVPLSLIPSSPQFWQIEDKLRSGRLLLPNPRAEVKRRFEKLLRAMRSAYDYIIIDTPPGRTFLSDLVTKSADLILVPSNPNPVAIWGLDLYEKELEKLGRHDRARWLWTLTDAKVKWEPTVTAFLERSGIPAITRVSVAPDGTDIKDNIPFPRLKGFEFAFRDPDRTPTTFARFYGDAESARLSELARFVMKSAEEASP